MRLIKIALAIFAVLGGAPTVQAKADPALEGARTTLPAALVLPSYRLWHGKAPGARGETEAEIPKLTLHAPQGSRGNGSAVIIAPGGAYLGLASALEGTEPAEWFASHGVMAFVLTYRVGAAARLPAVLQDGARAVRFVRHYATSFGIAPDRIGMMGFSAGGHLAASVAVGMPGTEGTTGDVIDRSSARPDFLVLGYPWLKGTEITSSGKSQYCDFAASLSIPCKSSDYEGYLPVRFVTANAPPTFIYHTTNDELVPVSGSLDFYSALHQKGVDVEMHLFENGPHGTGLGGTDAVLSQWPGALAHWLRAHDWIGSKAESPNR